MRLKFNKTAQEALDQIKSKRYAQTFAMKGKDVVNMLDWGRNECAEEAFHVSHPNRDKAISSF